MRRRSLGGLKMKRMILAFLLITILLSFTSCGNYSEPREIGCEEIIRAYEEAGFAVTHIDTSNKEGYPYLCQICVEMSQGEGPADSLYFTVYPTAGEASAAAAEDGYNPAVWLIAAIMGEGRWLKVGSYGVIEYSYYNPKMIESFNDLIKEK